MTDSVQIINLLQARGFDWAIQVYSPSNEAGVHYAQKLLALTKLMMERGIGKSAPVISSLQDLGTSNPLKLDAFLEALVSLKSPEMLTAAWRMIQGMQLDSLDLKFESAKAFSLKVSLESPYGEPETYSTDDIDDMNFVRHLMKSKSGDRPIINGFFALRRPK